MDPSIFTALMLALALVVLGILTFCGIHIVRRQRQSNLSFRASIRSYLSTRRTVNSTVNHQSMYFLFTLPMYSYVTKIAFLGSIPLISNPHYEHLQFVKKHSSNKHLIPQEHIKKLHEVASGHFGKVYKGKIFLVWA